MSTELKEMAKPQAQLSIRQQLQNPALLEQINKVLPSHMNADRMTRIALTAVTKTPKLNDCTPQSFFKCLLDLSSWGLEPDGRHAHLIPYGKECTLILDYKGIVELAYRSGYVKNIHADVVRAGDLFEYNLGRVVRHTPWAFRIDADRPKEAGEIVAAYCVVEMKDDAAKHEVMTRDEIDGIRKRSKASSSGPWVSDFAEMAKKTVFRRASKWLPLAAEMKDAFERDHDSLPAIQPQSKIESVDISELFSE